MNLMSDSNALFEDLKKLNSMFEELCWGHDDELIFSHDGERVIITNKTQSEN